MFFVGLAADFDGTLATDGRVPADVLDGLREFRRTGRRLLLITGRELPDLRGNLGELALFDRIVAENGGVLFEPATERQSVLAAAPPAAFVDALRSRGVSPLSVGNVIVATWEPHQRTVLDVIKELGLELQIIFNKGAVMILPPGINKASGLAAALTELEMSAHNIVGIGDAENDHAFLQSCGCAVAVANALPMLKESADIVTHGARGAGVLEIIRDITGRDVDLLPSKRAGIAVGKATDTEVVSLVPGKGSILLAGQSGIGKSTIATALTERMAEMGYQFCILDPEGDFEGIRHAITVGDAKVPPAQDEILGLLKNPSNNLVVSALAIPFADRPGYLAELLPKIVALRAGNGHPHWLIVDEAHHVLPAESDVVSERFPHDISATIFITVHPDSISVPVLKTVRYILACGQEASSVIEVFCDAAGIEPPERAADCNEQSVLYWECGAAKPPLCLKPFAPETEHKRHTRKYAEGELPPDRSFYFRGPGLALNLRAQNLMTFVQLAEGVDDATWEFHLRAHDYSRWFRDTIKDGKLAAAALAIENAPKKNAAETRREICDEIRARYTAPARGAA